MMGEAAILEEAMEDIGNAIYSKALEESQIEPVAPGSFEEFKEEDGQLKLVFTVPKMPEVELKDYRSQRFDLEIEDVTDETVNNALETIRENLAVVEEVDRPAKLGDELELDLTVNFWHDNEAHEHDDEDEDELDEDDDELDDEDEDELDEDDDEDEDEEHAHQHAHTLIDDENAKVVVREEGSDKDLFPGFSAHLIGLSKGEEKVFQLELPEDYPDETLAGQTVDVDLSVKVVRSRTLPAMNDMLAQNATNGEIDNLLDLRVKVRKDLEEAARQMAEDKVFNTAFEAITASADIHYPDVLVEEAIDDMMRDLDQRLQQNANVGLKDYLRIARISEQDLRERYREEAVKRVTRALIMREMVKAEQLDVDDAAIDKHVDKLSSQFGEQAELYRNLFAAPQNRAGLANELVTQRLIKRVVDIVTGKEPAIGPDPEETPEVVTNEPANPQSSDGEG
jgi:trigger factor